MRWRIPRELRFFDEFERQSAYVVRAAALLHALVNDFSGVSAAVQTIKNVEHAGDQVTHEVLALLHTVFITPFDRHDIHLLASRLDDVLDYVEAAASAMHVYRVKQPTPECCALTEVMVDCVTATEESVKCLRTADAVFYRHAETVHEHEHRADQLLRQSLASLFQVGADAIEVLKWKDIYELLEGVTDRCDDVVNTVEAIMLKEGVGPKRS